MDAGRSRRDPHRCKRMDEFMGHQFRNVSSGIIALLSSKAVPIWHCCIRSHLSDFCARTDRPERHVTKSQEWNPTHHCMPGYIIKSRARSQRTTKDQARTTDMKIFVTAGAGVM